MLHLICLLPGAGKTTLAKRSERENDDARLCPGEWIIARLLLHFTTEERDRPLSGYRPARCGELGLYDA